jgi:valyl-tRNA synthetase
MTTAPATPSSTTTDSELPTEWKAAEVEAHWYPKWMEAGVFAPTARRDRKPYVIMMPPPNVTGSLHMGHAIFVTLQDVLARKNRMMGAATLWLPGVDHAGIATQAVVERELKRHENKTRHDLGRGPFLERVWAWKHKNGDRIVEQLKAMGASADWSRERFTMDDQCNTAVIEAFVRLWNDGLVYRGERLINWDPALLTSVSDEEVEHEEKDGELWRFAYKVKGSADLEIVVATTRPETMLGDVAVAVHPDDERYTQLVGKELVHPFFADRKVVVIKDSYVDKEFGTGAVKITPAHDPNDFEMGQRNSLPMINIFTLDAKINDAGGEFAGLERGFARTKVKARLEELGLTRGTQPIKHNVAISQRSGVVIEPMLSRQFFVKTGKFAEDALRIVDGEHPETRILPEHWKKTWDHFHKNIRDWCVSRQLWWGHRIPVFYDLTKIDEVIEADANRKGRDTEATRAQAEGVSGKKLLDLALRVVDDDLIMTKLATASRENLAEKEPGRFVQEDDVLDTWFSSGLWPFATLGWPQQTPDLAAFYPGAVLETGSDILFFWVARMVWFGNYFMGKSPFKDVFLHTIVRDANGKKMSKSEGNALDPLDVMNGITLTDLVEKTKTYPVPPQKLDRVLKGIEKEFPEGIPPAGADGLRFTLAALSSHSRDVKLSIPRAKGYRSLMNKIWNAYRFGTIAGKNAQLKSFESVRSTLSLSDKYILSRLQRVVDDVSVAIDEYRFDAVANSFYSFFWDEFCSNYIELIKGTLEGEQGEQARDTAWTVFVHVLDAALRLLHPLAPFLTEDIWQRLPGRAERHPGVAFCAVAPWPERDAALVDADAERKLGLMIGAATLIRNLRQEAGLGPRKAVVVDVVAVDAATRATIASVQDVLVRFAALERVQIVDRAGYVAPKLSGSNASGDVEVVMHLEGLIDPQKEKDRLAREIAKADKDLAGLKKRFENADFVAKAPPEVVTEGKANMAALDEKILRLNAALQRLSA